MPILAAILIFCSESVTEAQWLSGYAYRRSIDIQESRIPGASALANFVILVDLTDNDLRSCSNGGYMENPNGWDIRFTWWNGSTWITLYHDIEGYDATTGRITAWVQIPSLSATSNTTIYLYFGNPSINTNSSSTATWNAFYRGVWHFNGTLNDATGNANNGNNFGTTTIAGNILEARNYREILSAVH